MTAITVTPMEPEWFGVQVEEGDVTTSHRIRVPEGFVDEELMAEVDPVRIVEESLGFLLERTPATSVPSELSLEDLAREHPTYEDELRARLGG